MFGGGNEEGEASAVAIERGQAHAAVARGDKEEAAAPTKGQSRVEHITAVEAPLPEEPSVGKGGGGAGGDGEAKASHQVVEIGRAHV